MVRKVNEHKHLGLILDSKLSFKSHLNVKVAIAIKGIGVTRYLSSYIPIIYQYLDQIYKMYVRTHLDFCDVICHIPEEKIVIDLRSGNNLPLMRYRV